MAPPVERPVRPRSQLLWPNVGRCTTVTLSCRVHGDGKTGQAVRTRRAHKLTARRSTLARSANHY